MIILPKIPRYLSPYNHVQYHYYTYKTHAQLPQYVYRIIVIIYTCQATTIK